MADPTNISALDAAIDAEYITAMNHSQLTGMNLQDSFDFHDMVKADVSTLSQAPQFQKQMLMFNPKADERTDPFTGVTAKEYAGILKPAADTARSWGYSAAAGAGMATAGFMKNLDLTVDFISRHTGMEKGGLFQKAHELALDRGEFYKSRAKELGITPIAEFFTELAGGLVPGIEDFLMDLPSVFPLHGTRAAEKAAQKGDNEFAGFFKGSMERLLMGQLFKAAHELSRPARSVVTGGLFEEQARAEGQTDPTELTKSFLTGGIFGIAGGPGKIGIKDVVNEIHNLREEMPALAPSKSGVGDSTIGSERGSTGGEEPPPSGRRGMTEKAIFIRSTFEKADAKARMEGRQIDPTQTVKDAEAEWDAANPPERTFYKPALRVDGEVFEANLEERIHGQIWDRIPADKLENAVDVESGYTDPKGGFVAKPPDGAEIYRGRVDESTPVSGEKTDPGASSREKQASMDLGPDLTPSQEADLIEAITGEKPDLAAIAKRSPEIMKLVDETRKQLTQKRRLNIKANVRAATGQRKVQDILEVKEMDALKDQIRYGARQAREAFSTGKVEGWNDAVLKLGIAAARSKEAATQREIVRGMIKDIKEVDTSEMMDMPRQEIDRLLEDITLVGMSSKKWLKLDALRGALNRDDVRSNIELPDYVLDDLARMDKRPIRDLTLDELDSLHKSVMSLAAQSKFGQKIWDGIQERRKETAIAKSIEEMRDPASVLGDLISTKPQTSDRFTIPKWVKNTLGMRQDSFDLIVEKLSGIHSVMYRSLYRMVKLGDPSGVIPGKGIIGQKGYIRRYHDMFRADLENAGFDFKKVKDVDSWLNERVKAKGDKTWELSRGERMAFYRHMLNEDNARAILESGIAFKRPPESAAKYGIVRDAVIPVSEKDAKAIIDSLSSDELIFAGTPVDNLFLNQGKEISDTHYSLNLYRIKILDKYYPKEPVPFTQRGFNLEVAEGQEAFRQFTARVGIDKGMLVERVGSTRPIYLNDLMGDITRSVNRASAYVHLEGPMRNASRLLYSPEFRREMVLRYGEETWGELEKGLKDISGSYRQWSETEQGLMSLKTKAVSGIVSLNPWIWINQPASLMFYNTYVDVKYLARGLADVATPSRARATLEEARSYSPELVDRLQTGYDRDVAAAYQQSREREFYGGSHTLREKGMMPTKWADLTGVLPGMRAAYYKAMDEFQTKELSKPVRDALDIQDPNVVDKWTPEILEKKAWEFADWVTERTQAQAGMEHRPPVSRGSSLEQVFTSLSSQTNTMLNLSRRTREEYKRTGDPADRDAMIKAHFQIFVLNAAVMVGIDRVRDLLYGRESKSYVHGFVDNAASMLIFVREIASAASSHFFEGKRGFDTRYPIQRLETIFTDSVANIHDILTTKDEAVKSKAMSSFIDNTIELVATLNGLPWHTPKRIVQAVTGNNPPPPKKRNEPDPLDVLIND